MQLVQGWFWSWVVYPSDADISASAQICPSLLITPIVRRLLGDEIGTIHSRTELTELLKIHVEHGALDVETGREVAGAMNYKELSVREVMTPMKDCFMLSVSEKLNFKVRVVLCSCVVFSKALHR